MKSFNQIIIDGRRWFQRTYGNTYHSVTVIVDGINLGNSDQHYGYGDAYRKTAFGMLQNAGYFEGMDYNQFCQYCYGENRHKVYFTVADVKREKDL